MDSLPAGLAGFQPYDPRHMPDRDTSVSKKVEGLHEEENALDRKENLKEKFAAKEQDNRKPGLRPQGPERDGSKMVREDAPGMVPTPSGRMRVVPDRFAAARKLEAERKAAEIQTRRSTRPGGGFRTSNARAQSRRRTMKGRLTP